MQVLQPQMYCLWAPLKTIFQKLIKCTHFYFTTGYSTHMIGKWHLGFCSWSYTPRYRGFDSFYGIYLGAGDHYTHETARILDLHDNETPVENKDGVYSTYLYAEVWNNNRFLFILFFFFFFRLAISPTWLTEKRNVVLFTTKKSSGSWLSTVIFFCDKSKSSEEWSSQLWTQLMQLRNRSPKKNMTSTGFIPVTQRYQCDVLTS